MTAMVRVDRGLSRAVLHCAAFLVVVAILAPIGMVLFATVRDGTPGSPAATWSMANLSLVYASPALVQPLLGTLGTCIPGALIALVLGTLLAWLVHRTDLPGYRWLGPALLTPIYFSPLSLAVGWVVLGAPRVGFLNVLWPLPGGVVNVYSWTAIILFIGFYYTPYVLLMLTGTLRSFDAGYEDASAILGARPGRTLRSVTLPMLRPQLLAAAMLVLIMSISMFAEPAVFGSRFRFTNLPLAIYEKMLNVPANFNLAAAIGTVLILGALVALLLYRRALENGERFVITQSRGFVVRRSALGRWKTAGLMLVWGYLLTVVILPVLALLATSFMRFQSPRPTTALLTVDNYVRVFDNPQVRDAIANTLVLSLGVATLSTMFGFLVAYAVVRREIRGSSLVDAVSVLPMGVPAIVLSLGFLWAYLWLPIGIYGTVWALIIALATVTIPTTVRSMDSALRGLGTEAEFSARLLGAGPSYRLFTIVIPMLRGPLLAAWLFAFMLTTIQVSVPLVLRSPSQETLSVMVWTLITDSGSVGQSSVVALVQGLIAGCVVLLAGWAGRSRSEAA